MKKFLNLYKEGVVQQNEKNPQNKEENQRSKAQELHICGF